MSFGVLFIDLWFSNHHVHTVLVFVVLGFGVCDVVNAHLVVVFIL